VFGEGVPSDLGKFAANTGQHHKLEEMLQEQVDKGERVQSWDEFAKPLVEAWRNRRLKPVRSSK
jgi:hypothetical protein